MSSVFQKISAVSAIEEVEERRIARLLETLLWTSFAAASLVLIISAVFREWQIFRILVLGNVLIALGLWFVRRGAQRVIGLVLTFTILGLTAYFHFIGQGIHDVGTVLYPLAMVVGGLVISRRAYVILVGLAVAMVWGIVYAELNGYITTGFKEATSYEDFFTVSVIIIVMAVFTRLLADSTTDSLRRSRLNERALTEVNRRLEKQADELRLSEAKWRSLVENAPDIIMNVQRDGHVSYCNTAGFATAVGPVSLYDFVESDDHEGVRNAVEKVFSSATTGRYDLRGRYFGSHWYDARFSPVMDGKDVVSMTLIATDMTEHKEAERERERLISELEAKNSELERFTYTVSHDLKSPLITIKGFLSLLTEDLQGGKDEQARGDMERISAAADKMGALLNDLLTLSRIGRISNPSERVPMRPLVDEALQAVKGQIESRGVEVIVAPDLGEVWGDQARITELLQNLIENAVKYMGDQAMPRIEMGAEKASGRPVYFVRDNGIGIDPRYQEKVFGLFDRLNASVEGTGVGLAFVKRIVEVHGGRIWIESEGEGHGTTFKFTLPDRAG